jgi:hypothetical protein
VAAGIPQPVKPAVADDNMKKAIDLVVNNPGFKKAYNRHLGEAFLEVMRIMTPEEQAIIKEAVSLPV